MRVPEQTPGTSELEGIDGRYLRQRPAQLPAGRRVLVLGGSAAWGPGNLYADTFSAVLQKTLRERLADPTIQVCNLARPGWDLVRVKQLLLRVVAELQPPPTAVVLLSGNNEFLHTEQLVSAGPPPPVRSSLYALMTHGMTRLGWLPPPPGTKPAGFVHLQPGHYSAAQVRGRVWRAGSGVHDASHWTAIRQTFLTQYARRLQQPTAELRRRKIPLVLVPPPINLHYFPGAVSLQPATFKALGSGGYRAAVGQLQRALDSDSIAALQQLVQQYPDGPLQRFYLGQLLDRAGRHAEARTQLMAGRDSMMGLLGALPSMAAACRRLAGPGVTVLRPQGWYEPPRPMAAASLSLFFDSCHMTAAGHSRLARELTAALVPVLVVK